LISPRRIKAAHRRRLRCASGPSVHRYYDPATGRYLESDPIGLGGGISTYSYVGAAPLSAVDPLGLQATTATGAFGSSMAPAVGIETGTPGFNEGLNPDDLEPKVPTPGSPSLPSIPSFDIPAEGALSLLDFARNPTPYLIRYAPLLAACAINDSGLGETKPNDAPPGTIGLDEAARRNRWSKDQSHGIKDAATGNMGGGRTWVGVTPSGIVGVNENGHWSPQGHHSGLWP
jgi:uncharacterized protein RhaS with RHS repeats